MLGMALRSRDEPLMAGTEQGKLRLKNMRCIGRFLCPYLCLPANPTVYYRMRSEWS